MVIEGRDRFVSSKSGRSGHRTKGICAGKSRKDMRRQPGVDRAWRGGPPEFRLRKGSAPEGRKKRRRGDVAPSLRGETRASPAPPGRGVFLRESGGFAALHHRLPSQAPPGPRHKDSANEKCAPGRGRIGCRDLFVRRRSSWPVVARSGHRVVPLRPKGQCGRDGSPNRPALLPSHLDRLAVSPDPSHARSRRRRLLTASPLRRHPRRNETRLPIQPFFPLLRFCPGAALRRTPSRR
jgi:hypothetical protein